VATALTTALRVPAQTAAVASAESFGEFVRQHQKRVYRVISLLVKDADAADTLTQECFLRAYQNLQNFRGECRVETWLLRIAVNLVRDHAKNRRASFWKKLVGLDEAGQSSPLATPRPSPERELLARAEVKAVLASVESLSAQQKTVFLLRFVEEMSLGEISEVMGLRVGSVKAHLFRALGSVRQMMKEQQWR
jgi:RNA polymerase sigma-70 factor, ECF subfamily